MLVEAKRDNLNSGLRQCIAQMVAAQRFNEAYHHPLPTIYGSVTTGTAWRFLKLEKQIVTNRCERLPVSPRRTNSGDAGLDGTRGLEGDRVNMTVELFKVIAIKQGMRFAIRDQMGWEK